MLIQSTSFAIPDPILVQLRALGNVVTATKQHLYPSFPPLPTAVLADHGGYYPPLVVPAVGTDDTVHLLYEEIPCLGVAAHAVQQAISNAPPGPYVSHVTYNNQQPTANLLGFRPLGNRRPEAKNLAFDNGITDVFIPEYPVNTGLCLDFLVAISNILANTKTFKVSQTVFSTLTEIGAQSQIVIEHPQPTAGHPTIAIRAEIRPDCLIKEPEAVFGSGIFFCPQLLKVAIPAANLRTWALFPNIPQEWIDNRNLRRNLPVAYMQSTFSALSQRASAFRLNIIKSMTLTKR